VARVPAERAQVVRRRAVPAAEAISLAGRHPVELVAAVMRRVPAAGRSRPASVEPGRSGLRAGRSGLRAGRSPDVVARATVLQLNVRPAGGM
jgi:hypothetical protein